MELPLALSYPLLYPLYVLLVALQSLLYTLLHCLLLFTETEKVVAGRQLAPALTLTLELWGLVPLCVFVVVYQTQCQLRFN